MDGQSEEINIVATLKIKPECIETARPIVEALIEATRKEEGNLKYDFFKDAKEEGTFVVLETFKNMAAFQEHLAAEHFKVGVEKLKEFSAAPSEIRILKHEYVAKK